MDFKKYTVDIFRNQEENIGFSGYVLDPFDGEYKVSFRRFHYNKVIDEKIIIVKFTVKDVFRIMTRSH